MRQGNPEWRHPPDAWNGQVIQAQYRRAAAVLAADVVGFSAMMGHDEDGTLAKILTLRREIMAPSIDRHHGRIVKTIGDGVLAIFASSIDAVTCALHIHATLLRAHQDGLQLRTGIHASQIIVADDGDIYGHGVNIATRLQQLAAPGHILVSAHVRDEIGSHGPVAFIDAGDRHLHNIAGAMRTFHPRLHHDSRQVAPGLRP
jgi:adenylate cyclase